MVCFKANIFVLFIKCIEMQFLHTFIMYTVQWFFMDSACCIIITPNVRTFSSLWKETPCTMPVISQSFLLPLPVTANYLMHLHIHFFWTIHRNRMLWYVWSLPPSTMPFRYRERESFELSCPAHWRAQLEFRTPRLSIRKFSTGPFLGFLAVALSTSGNFSRVFTLLFIEYPGSNA